MRAGTPPAVFSPIALGDAMGDAVGEVSNLKIPPPLNLEALPLHVSCSLTLVCELYPCM